MDERSSKVRASSDGALATHTKESKGLTSIIRTENNRLPNHNICVHRRSRHPRGRVIL